MRQTLIESLENCCRRKNSVSEGSNVFQLETRSKAGEEMKEELMPVDADNHVGNRVSSPSKCFWKKYTDKRTPEEIETGYMKCMICNGYDKRCDDYTGIKS